jgi:mannose-6-phosphate isomerase-like protein (cupin superfamily)
MTRHTIVNLKQVEPSEAARAAGIDAHMSRSRLDSEHLGVSYFRYPPDFRPGTGHHHREQEEAYVVISGSGRMRLDDEIREIRQWDVIRVAPSVVRAFEAGPEGLDVIAVGGNKPEGGDGVPSDSPWPDA